MRILDKYLMREYIKSFLILLASLSVVFIVIDIIDNLPRLMRNGASVQEAAWYLTTKYTKHTENVGYVPHVSK